MSRLSNTVCLVGRTKKDNMLVDPSALYSTVLWGSYVIIPASSPGRCIWTTAQNDLGLI